MATPKQIAANRANAQKSTGPTTEAGKLAVSQNARTHGLTGQTIWRASAQDEAYDAYSAALLADLAPATALELDFARRIVHDSWRLNRAGAIDDNLVHDTVTANESDFSESPYSRALDEARAYRAEAHTLHLLTLYEQRLQRAVLKNMAILKAMQAERLAKSAEPPQPADAMYAMDVAAKPVAAQPNPLYNPLYNPLSSSLHNGQSSPLNNPQASPLNKPQIVEAAAPPAKIGFDFASAPAEPAPSPASAVTTPENMAA